MAGNRPRSPRDPTPPRRIPLWRNDRAPPPAPLSTVAGAGSQRRIWNFDVCTDDLAEQWGSRIARTGVLEHRDQGEVIRRCRHTWAGETLVRGTALTPDEMVRLWLASSDHREILLNPDARRAGVAITEDPQGRVVGVVDLVRHR